MKAPACLFYFLLSILTRTVAGAPTASQPSHVQPRQSLNITGPVMDTDFADPSPFWDNTSQTWYAVATAGNGHQVQVARSAGSSLAGPWTLLALDLLPTSPAWATGHNTWSPDLRRLLDGRYVLYFSAVPSSAPTHFCIGAAVADDLLGPYAPVDTPLACPLAAGGAIDPAGFQDVDGSMYVLYKVDGNSAGHGGACMNSVPPLAATPILLQRVDPADGVTALGDPVQILDRAAGDGPLVEAPSLLRASDAGEYVLFFSSGCFQDTSYDVKVAVAASVAGPYVRAPAPLLGTGSAGLTSPGGAGATALDFDGRWALDGASMAFHADCDFGRCMFVAGLVADASEVAVATV
ncbi:endo-arabinase [Xylariomycetidae sp. FL0641]|nr:endo-arabinase [Xylariomycetidae sp. FL0641]